MELNREQIKKALECCIEGECDGCTYDEQTACKEYLLTDALSLIKELTEENEKLISTSSLQGAIIGSLQVAVNELTADKERLEKLLDDKCDRCIERERADTVRKMQERLKAASHIESTITGYRYSVVDVVEIDQIAKEMLEGVL